MSAPTTSLRVVLAASGVFHHFELAHELARRDFLLKIYSTFPWLRLKRERLDRRFVDSFPYLHAPRLALGRYIPIPDGIDKLLQQMTITSFDSYIARTLPECDVYVALSGSGLLSGRRAQESGAHYVCDRGSSHIQYQADILKEERAIWGLPSGPVDPFMIDRELAEYQQADAIVVPSIFSLRTFEEMGVPRAKLYRIPYGVRLDNFRPVAEPPSDTFSVLFVGTISLRKGIPYLLDAFQKLKHPSKKLRLIGSVLPEMKAVLPRFNLENVEIMGHIPQAALSQFMSSSHVMVLPSIEDGFGLVLGQAMACGCPLIASDHTGGMDIFSDQVEGFMVPIRSSQSILDRLQLLADAPGLQKQMGMAALQKVTSLGGWASYGQAWEQLLHRLAGSK